MRTRRIWDAAPALLGVVRRSIHVLLAALAAALLAAPAARAATLTSSSGTVTFQSGPGEADDVTATDGGGWSFQSRAGTLFGGTGCPGSGTEVRCDAGGLELRLDDQDDRAEVRRFAFDMTGATVRGGTGADRITVEGMSSMPGRTQVFGDADDDTILAGGVGADVNGGAGDDTVTLSPAMMGLFDVVGGPGADSVVLAAPGAAMSVTLDDQGGDGGSFLQANIHGDVENVTTGALDDKLVGSAAANRLDGAAGDDRLIGGAGADVLLGGEGRDSIESIDGEADRIDCGPGADSATADGIDIVTGCEAVTRTDSDQDGYPPPQDCDDANPRRNPGVADVPDNGLDENCDGVDTLDPDRDRDGVARPRDCRDDRSDIHPGAVDRPRDGIDQDCDDRDADWPVPAAGIVFGTHEEHGGQRFTRLRVTGLQGGETIRLTCRGDRCPRRSFAPVRAAAGTLRLERLLGRRALGRGSQVTVSVSRPGSAAKVFRLDITRSGAVLQRRCQRPGEPAPVPCWPG